MKKTEDGYKAMLNLLRDIGGNAGLQSMPQIGTILEPPPNIKVKWNGMVLDKKWFYIDDYWIQGHTRQIKGHIVSATQNRSGGGGDAMFASHNHDIDNDYTASIIYTDTWHVGDKILMIPIQGSDNKTVKQFWILSKGKRLDGN